ncbi:hypothetical protein B0H13DRAFT_2669600 [Mycena leptocephala]|nr:hypothetical protein B0H13DRAFT_2669600 [Mycena leptocephala]
MAPICIDNPAFALHAGRGAAQRSHPINSTPLVLLPCNSSTAQPIALSTPPPHIPRATAPAPGPHFAQDLGVDPVRFDPASIGTGALAAWAPIRMLPMFNIVPRHYDRAEIQQHDPRRPIQHVPLRCLFHSFSPLLRFPPPEGLFPHPLA